MNILRNEIHEGIEDSIINFELKYSIELPKEYKEFLRENNGGCVDPNYKVKIDIPDTSDVVTFRSFFGFTDRKDDDLFVFNKRFTRVEGAKIIAIAKTYEGGIFVFNYEDGKIYYWDVRLKMEESTNEASAYYISDDFCGLIDIINKSTIKKEKGENKMEAINFLPLGSIVKLNGGIQRLMITSRGLIVNHKEEEFFFDYAGVMYPEGLLSDQVIYFNADNIADVIFEGFSDDDDKVIIENINKYIEDHPDLVWGDVNNWNK